jgi:hypothetical protein
MLGVGSAHNKTTHGMKLKGYYPYFGVQPFTFPSKYFATLQKGRGKFFVNPSK